jgi:hypothetical protein
MNNGCLYLEAQIRLVNYCCTLLHKSVLDDDHKHHHHHQKRSELNHLIYGEQHSIVHSLGYAILTFLSVIRCRKEIGTFYRENEHFRELLSAMRHKYGPRSEFISRDPTISNALSQVASAMFDRQQRKKRRHHHYHYPQEQSDGNIKQHSHDQFQDEEEDNYENQQYRKCSNSLCQMIENDVSYRKFKKTIFTVILFFKKVKFQRCPHCHKLSYCSQYCREVHWTLNHNISCRSMNHDGKKEDSTVLCIIDRFSETLPRPYQENNTVSMSHNSAFETLPVQMSQPVIEATAEITNELCYPPSSSTSSTAKKKSLKTLLSFLRVGSKRR